MAHFSRLGSVLDMGHNPTMALEFVRSSTWVEQTSIQEDAKSEDVSKKETQQLNAHFGEAAN